MKKDTKNVNRGGNWEHSFPRMSGEEGKQEADTRLHYTDSEI